MLIGRGEDFAWSLTSAGSDLIDTFAEELCGGSTRRYRYKGRCRSMDAVDAGTIEGVGRVVFDTTVHGPVTAYATSGGQADRAVAQAGELRQGHPVPAPVPRRHHRQGALGEELLHRLSASPYTFNVAYADDRDIAMYSAGRLPLRDRRVDPRLPTRGTGQYEWEGYLSADDHPHQTNPKQGQLVNWNNRPAPGWGAADNNRGYGSTHRVALLNAQLARSEQHDPASVTRR